MKQKLSLLLPTLLWTVFGCWSCSSGNASSGAGCTVEGSTTFTEYTHAYLLTAERTCLDSVALSDGKFRFEVTDSVTEPYAVIVRLGSSLTSDDSMDMPVIVERGTVRLDLGEYIHTSGTPLNAGIQTFLDGLQQCKDGVLANDSIAVDEIRAIFSAYYKEQILANRGNALGLYILQNYGNNLTEEDRAAVE